MAPTRQAVRARDAALPGHPEQGDPAGADGEAALLQHVSKQDFTTIAADAAQRREEPARLHRRLLRERPGDPRAVRPRQPGHPAGRGEDAATRSSASSPRCTTWTRCRTHDMGYVFEHLIRKFYEDSNETAGEHFTPREVIELMVNLLIAPDEDTITGEGQVINILDPACGTGGMLTTAAEDKHQVDQPERRGLPVRPGAQRASHGRSCESEMLLRDQPGTIELGNSFSSDRFPAPEVRLHAGQSAVRRGVEEGQGREVEDEAEIGYAGRFGAGLPRINDGSFLFLQHMISKMDPVEGKGCRLAIVFNGSPLFTGGGRVGRVGDPAVDPGERLAGGHRRAAGPALLQHGISTYFWILSNRKDPSAARQGHPAGCPRPVGEDAQVPRRQAQADQRASRSSTSPSCTWTRLPIAADAEHPDHGR